MRARRTLLNLLATVIATVQAFAPGVVSVADARPAALAVSQGFAPHVESTGQLHDVGAHLDDCALCQLVLRTAATKPAPCTLEPLRAVAWPTHSDYRATRGTDERWSAPSRAPPLA